MSSSALLVCELTDTDIYVIIVKVLRQVLVPLLVTAALYLYLGRGWGSGAAEVESTRIFTSTFYLAPVTLLPAGIIILFSMLRIRVELTMLVSIVAAAAICVVYQDMGIIQVMDVMVRGYHARDLQLAALIDGGGLKSMVSIGAIVAISSAYFGIFSATNLLSNLKQWVLGLASRSNVFFVTVLVSFITCAISCNQTLATMLTCEMTKTLTEKKETLAVNLEMSPQHWRSFPFQTTNPGT